MNPWVVKIGAVGVLFVSACTPTNETIVNQEVVSQTVANEEVVMEKAVFAAGCFWGVEAIFKDVDGVLRTTVGYTGGHVENPTYEQVCRANTGHAEAVEVEFDPARVSYETLLDVFWRLHDPTTPNRQGPDRGPQYRSAIFYRSPEQLASAETEIKIAQKKWKKPIVTTFEPARTFYPAEAYHQNYFDRHYNNQSCHFLRD